MPLAIPSRPSTRSLVEIGPVRDPLVRARLYRRHRCSAGATARRLSPTRPVARAARRTVPTTSSSGSTLGIIIGGRLGYVLFYKPGLLPREPARDPAVWHGGMSFHGGLVGVDARDRPVRAAPRHRRSCRWLDVAAAVAPIGLFFGRIANFINAELWGRVTDVPWAVVFPHARAAAAPSEPALRGGARRPAAVHRARVIAAHASARCSGPASSPASSARLRASPASSCEFFRQPDAQLGYLMAAARPWAWCCRSRCILVGIGCSSCDVSAPRRACRLTPHDALGARSLARRSARRPDLARALHGARASATPARLLRHARPARRGRRLHHRARDQPDVRRADRLLASSISGSSMGRPEPSPCSSSAPAAAR